MDNRASTLSGDHQVTAGQPTDMEIICAFMEKRPGLKEHGGTGLSAGNWWFWGGSWIPRELTLDAIYKVERQLGDEQRRHYCVLIFHFCCPDARSANPIEDFLTSNRWRMIHADAATKIKALAAVLRAK